MITSSSQIFARDDNPIRNGKAISNSNTPLTPFNVVKTRTEAFIFLPSVIVSIYRKGTLMVSMFLEFFGCDTIQEVFSLKDS